MAATPTPPAVDGSSPQTRSFSGQPPMVIDPAKRYTATLTTSLGEMKIALDAVAAPLTVNNFVFLARYRYYDGLIFHRVISGFMIQGGCPDSRGTGGPGYKFADELPKPGRYEIGSLAMANSGPNTNGSQFFVVTGSSGVGLPPLYSLFGKVVKGVEVAQAIQNVSKNRSDKPDTDVVIQSVVIEEHAD
jgi:peptidylprolyl isomerase